MRAVAKPEPGRRTEATAGDSRRASVSGLGAIALLLVPGALTVYLSFNAGGFFVGATAIAALVLCVVLILRFTLFTHALGGVSLGLVLAVGALALYAAWALVSQSWSHAPSRALLEYDRALLYVLALVAGGVLARTAPRLRWLVRGLAVAIVVVCAFAVVSRILPHVLPTAPDIANQRLSYPLTYWNALGLLASFGAIFCLHLACDDREPTTGRVLGAAAVPLLASTVYFTFSRGGIGAGIVGLVVYLLVARPRAVLGGLLATVPATLVAVKVAYDANLLATVDPTTPAAVAQGHHVAAVLVACIAGAALVRVLLLPLDRLVGRGLDRMRVSRRIAWSGVAAVVVAAVVVAVALHAPATISHQYDRFLHAPAQTRGDLRNRLTDPSNNGRIPLWKVALRGFDTNQLHGRGAGTFHTYWDQQRTLPHYYVVHAHSLYLQTLDELGVVGLVLLAVALLTILFGLARRIRGRSRAVYGALFAATVAWIIHAGIDWDWEMPAVTLWVFAAGGAALAARRGKAPAAISSPGRIARIVLSLGVLALAITPATLAVSQAKLNTSVQAYENGDCRRAIDAALGSISAVSSRPEPFEVLGYCDARLGATGLAIQAMSSAIRRDPRNWETYYGLALVRGADGLDPRGAARAALRLDPLGDLTREAAAAFRTADPRKWSTRARRARVPIQ